MGKKRNKFFKISLLIIITISGILSVTQIQKYIRYSNKEKIINFVKSNLGALNENYDLALSFGEVETKESWSTTPQKVIVNFVTRGSGIVPSTIYTGFYFTSFDNPVGYEGSTYPLTKNEKGWEWKEEDGDNWYYTEKIDDYWYYYEAGF